MCLSWWRHSQYGIPKQLAGTSGFIPRFPSSPRNRRRSPVLLITASILIRSKIGTDQPIAWASWAIGPCPAVGGLAILLIVLQPDLKSAIVLPPMVFSMLYVSKLSGRFFAVSLGAFLLVVVGVVGWDILRVMPTFMESSTATILFRDYKPTALRAHIRWVPLAYDYQRNRILPFVDLGARSIRSGHHGLESASVADFRRLRRPIRQGLDYAGTQAQPGLPAALRSRPPISIFSVIAEEKGFLGKHYGSQPVWSGLVQRHSHRRSRPRGLASAPCSPSASRCC